jgi:hypothetical protein
MKEKLANEPFFVQIEVKEMIKKQDKEIKELEQLRSQSLVTGLDNFHGYFVYMFFVHL